MKSAKVLIESLDFVDRTFPYEMVELSEEDWETLAHHFQAPEWEFPPMFYKTLTVTPVGFQLSSVRVVPRGEK